jgi:hypothetical protein
MLSLQVRIASLIGLSSTKTYLRAPQATCYNALLNVFKPTLSAISNSICVSLYDDSMVTGVLGNVLVLSPLVIVAQGRLTHRLLVALTDDIVNSQMGFQLYYADMGTFVLDIRIYSCGEYEGVSGEDMYGTTGEAV